MNTRHPMEQLGRFVQCGSSIGFRAKDASFSDIELAVATFDDDIPISVNTKIYTDFKANWHELNDNCINLPEGK